MTSLYSVTREDLYDYDRCPKIISIKAYQTLRAEKHVPNPSQRPIEPVAVGLIGEEALQLGLGGVEIATAMRKMSCAIPEIDKSQLLRQIAVESLRGVEEIRRRLRSEFGDITIIGKGQGRQPDLAGAVLPDRIAFSSESKTPFIVEVKNTRHQGPADRFQAKFYNGVAETSGLYLLEERVEGRAAKLAPRIIHGATKTILVYPRLAASTIIDEKFVPTQPMIDQVWIAKQLGLAGLSIETDCGSDCPHLRLKVDLSEGNMEALPPLPLVFSKSMLEQSWDFDKEFQVKYALKLLPERLRTALLFHTEKADGQLERWRNWLVQDAGIDGEAAEIALNFNKHLHFNGSKPNPAELMKSMKVILERWNRILKKRLRNGAPFLIGKATSVYSLPAESARFINNTWKKWEE